MDLLIVIISSIFISFILAVVWVTYKYITKKKRDKIIMIKAEKKSAELNMEEVSLKALEKPKESLGKLVYAIRYVPDSQSLRVTVKSGHDLCIMAGGGTSDPYVKVWLKDNPKIKCETKVKRRTKNPVYNEEFTFTIPPEDVEKQTVIFFLYDFDRFSKHEAIGCLMIDLSGLDLSKMVEDWAELDPPNSDVNTEIPLGDICISIKYEPDEEKLFVIILEAKGLRKHEEEDLYDPYVKVSLEEAGKIIKKKLTSVKKSTPNPYYNEEFVFSLTVETSTKAQLVITVYNCNGTPSKTSMPVGTIILGPCITGAGLKHWREVIANPKRSIVRWHSLVEMIENKPK